jgi:hypothetical protein
MKTYGFLLRKNSLWMGLHYSKYTKRYCFNILPCCTIWWIKEGGTIPTDPSEQWFKIKSIKPLLYQLYFLSL